MTFSAPTPSSARTPGFRRGRRVSDLMTPDHHAFVESSLAAERAGDAASALDYHRGVPMFRRSGHGVVLEQLADLADEMAPWIWARWAAYQCTRVEDTGTASAAAGRVSLRHTVAMFHGDDMARAYESGGDPMRVIARVSGQSWVFHQICTFELGGLESFLEEMPTARLAEECGLAREWVGAQVGGYRVESSPPGTLVVRDLATKEAVELLDLGAAVHADEGGWLIGRLVPSGTTPGLMFDTRPLAVDRRTASAAARGQRRGQWVVALHDALRDGRVDPAVLCSEDRELVTDVAGLRLLERGTPPAALASAHAALADGRDEIGRAAYRILRGAVEGTFGDDDAAYVAAAVVHPRGYAEARRQLRRPEHRPAWEHWAGLVPDPARGRLRRLAELSGTAAA
ncbi:hypothetical protein [Nocardioides sp.]|uniref:hypothetical protein n=1 Tax=Nocardioides sp. TaxID=35761 RepID=UPI0025D31F59|nr:hypothetical protein [Nocardioides sp.]